MKKIPTLFERVYENHKIVDILPNVTPGMEWVLDGEGIATVKIDGSCCAIIDGEFYKRYDAKNGKPIPIGAIKCQDEADPITGHLPCWVKVEKEKPDDKWFIKAFDYARIDCLSNLADGTYEAIGKHFNGNPYNMEYDVLVPHGREIIEVEHTFEGIKKFLSENRIEGIMFWLNGKPQCKIKRSDFGYPWRNRQ